MTVEHHADDFDGTTIGVVVNGDTHQMRPGATITDLVATMASGPKGIAVARNGEVVPRSAWAATELGAGDHIEVLTAAQGG